MADQPNDKDKKFSPTASQFGVTTGTFKRPVVDLARAGATARTGATLNRPRQASDLQADLTPTEKVPTESEATLAPTAPDLPVFAGAASAAETATAKNTAIPVSNDEAEGELSFEALQAQLRGAQSAAEKPAEEEISFDQLQAQLRQFKDTRGAEVTISGEPEDKTAVNPNSPKHRGVLASDYDGPSYSELRKKAAASGEPQNRLALPVGYQLQEYRIERVLGIGGFGISYLAHDTNLNSKVAIKEYLPNDLAMRDEQTAAVWAKSEADSEEYKIGLDRFLLESRTLATFRHANIVRVSRFFETNNTAYMVMDYEYGESLNAWLKKRLDRGEAIPDEKTMLQIFIPLLNGLDLVHQTGFLHRDIKPANIYVRDSDGSLVLLDFGAARLAKNAVDNGLTSIVTPGYAPFEQYHSHGRQGPWSDLYAFGGVLYWMICGKKPIEAAARIQNDPQEPATVIGKGKYSENFLKAIDWALLPDDQKRPQSVDELKPVLIGDNDLSNITASGGKRGRRTWVKWAIAATLALAAGVGYSVYKAKSGGLSGEPFKLGLIPGGSREAEQIQMKSSMQPLIDLMQNNIGRPIQVEITRSFKPDEGQPKDALKYDIIMAVTHQIGGAARDQNYQVVGKFRDLFALVMVRADSEYVKFADMKNARVGLLSRATSIGPIGMITLNGNGLEPKDFKEFREFKLQDEMIDALAERKVDVIIVSVASSEEGLKRYGNRLRVFQKSDPFPGYGIGLAPNMPKETALKITQHLWKLDENPEGKVALAAVLIGSAAGSAQIAEATSREFVRATEQIERARKLYPGDPPK